MSTLLLGVAAAAAISLAIAPPTPVRANHIYSTYPERGFHWHATSSNYAELWVVSNNCNQSELDAFAAAKNSTTNAPEFGGKWPSGLQWVRSACNGHFGGFDDVSIDYMTSSRWCQVHRANGGCATHGGENHATRAPTDYCKYWYQRYPCGTHIAQVHINKAKFDGGSASYRQRLLMHETAHSQGLAHHCAEAAIGNQGTSGCTWRGANAYQPTDRAGIRSIYPNHPYPTGP